MKLLAFDSPSILSLKFCLLIVVVDALLVFGCGCLQSCISVLTITFQAFNDDEFCPIGIQPPIRLSEYRMDFDSSTRCVTCVQY
jgi:hypothetical protein